MHCFGPRISMLSCGKYARQKAVVGDRLIVVIAQI